MRGGDRSSGGARRRRATARLEDRRVRESIERRALAAESLAPVVDRAATAAGPVATRRGGVGHRYLTAGQMFLAGVLCFALWLFFDARQLYQSAQTAPIGVRREVAMAIMRPIASVEEKLSMDRIVNLGDRAIGKTGTPGGSAIGPTVAPTTTAPAAVSPGRGRKEEGSTTSRKGAGRGRTGPSSKTVGPPAVKQPTAAHPLTVLDIGDSIGEDLGIGLADELGAAPHVRLIQASVGDTGLANLGYYDWLAQLPSLLRRYDPQVVVVMLGGNDAQSFQAGPLVVQFGTAEWRRIYPARVAELMTEATDAGAHLVWVGLPIMGPTSGLSNTDMEEQNSVYQAEAASHPGVTYVSSWKLFENSAGQYSTYLPINGGLVEVRDPDEVHIDPPGGTDYLGAYVVKAMEKAFHITL